eukprot:7686713-Pyramimonas_sp.AAC.1
MASSARLPSEQVTIWPTSSSGRRSRRSEGSRRSSRSAFAFVFLVLARQLAAMIRVATTNTTSYGPLATMLETEHSSLSDGSIVVIAKGHHRVPEQLQYFQVRVTAAGYHGVWAAATPSEGGGAQGGVAALAPKRKDSNDGATVVA